ncbi:MAG: DUF2185 domain-containing protein [Bacteroidia bacterium]
MNNWYLLLSKDFNEPDDPEPEIIPSQEEISKIKVGKYCRVYVKLITPQKYTGDYLSVIIKEIRENIFTGFIASEPQIEELKLGDLIEFEAKHIIQIRHDDQFPIITIDDGRELLKVYDQLCSVDKRILENKARINYLFRSPIYKDDIKHSGWIFMVNKESDEFIETKSNFITIPVKDALEFPILFFHALFNKEGTWFERIYDWFGVIEE